MSDVPREPVFRHVDDSHEAWQEVKRQRNADGSTSSVWERWFAFRGDPPYLSLLARWDPGMIVRRHGHRSPHVLYVIDGELWCGERHCPTGTHIELPEGAAFGPFRAGPHGVTLFEVMLGDPRSWGDQPELVDELRAAHGVTELPDPPIELPGWLADERSRWGTPGDGTA